MIRLEEDAEETTMIKAVNIKAEWAELRVLHGRGKETTEAKAEAAFADLLAVL